MYFPLLAPNGKDVELVVKEKDKVKVGTRIIQRVDFEVPIFSSVSGKVKGIENRYSALLGKNVDHLVIENDFKYEEEKLKTLDPEKATREELVNAIKEAGMVGLGGAGFPTYVKYATTAPIESILINAVECEPYLTTDYVAMINEPKLFLDGVSILVKAGGAKEAVVAFKKNKKELKEVLDKELENYPNIRIQLVPDKYPMGWEKSLVKEVFKKTYERLPADAGIIVSNAQTALSVAKALLKGECIHNRIVTVSGDAVKEPQNVLVPVGTLSKGIIDKCGGTTCEEVCVLAGGPMTSKAALNEDFPIYTSFGAITLMKSVKINSEACLKCGRCIEHCPAGLQPIQIKNAFDAKDIKDLEAFQVSKCVECGMCSYVCPSKIELTDTLKKAKLYLRLSQTKK